MGAESRVFPRVEARLKIDYEFVAWQETELSTFINPEKGVTFDISTNGVGLSDLQGVNPALLKLLELGKKKAKLAVHLAPDRPPLMTFARLVWSSDEGGKKRFGFMFIEVSQFFFNQINGFVQKESSKKKK